MDSPFRATRVGQPAHRRLSLLFVSGFPSACVAGPERVSVPAEKPRSRKSVMWNLPVSGETRSNRPYARSSYSNIPGQAMRSARAAVWPRLLAIGNQKAIRSELYANAFCRESGRRASWTLASESSFDADAGCRKGWCRLIGTGRPDHRLIVAIVNWFRTTN